MTNFACHLDCRSGKLHLIMSRTAFDPKSQQRSLSAKIVAGLERLSEAFKALLWMQAKNLGISPLQMQVLIFIAYHRSALCNVSHLAKEFNLSKPTLSDVIKVLDRKGLISKDYHSDDSRRFTIALSPAGEKFVLQTENFAKPIRHQIAKLDAETQSHLFESISKLIFGLNKSGVLTVQRTCYACRFFDSSLNLPYCQLLQKSLNITDIRIDCPEFEDAD